MRALRLFFFLYLLVEIIGIFYITKHIGLFAMFAEVVISAFIGGLLLLNIRADVMDTLSGLSQNKRDFRGFVRGSFAKVFGSILLILPGVFCDVFGVIILINAFFILRNKQQDLHHHDEDIIDIEIVDEKKQS